MVEKIADFVIKAGIFLKANWKTIVISAGTGFIAGAIIF